MVSIHVWGEWRISWVSSENVDELQRMLDAGDIDGVGASPYKGCSDLGVISGLRGLSGVVLPYAESYDLGVLDMFLDIKFLSVGDHSGKLDLSAFKGLVDLSLSMVDGDVLPSASTGIKRLHVSGMRSKHKALDRIPDYTNMIELEIVGSNVIDLKGLSRFLALRSLNLAYCKNLSSIADVVGVGLLELCIERCKKLSDFEVLAGCEYLKSIKMDGVGDIQNLGFIRKIKALEEFRFVNFRVVDGDMTHLFGLKSVGFISRRDYSHTYEQVVSVIAKKGS